jgi:hypothetical protein
MKDVIFTIVLLIMLQVIVTTFNHYNLYYALIPVGITIAGVYLYIKRQTKSKSNEKSSI